MLMKMDDRMHRVAVCVWVSISLVGGVYIMGSKSKDIKNNVMF